MIPILRRFPYLLIILLLFSCSKKSTDGDGEKPPPFWSRYSDFEAAWSPDGQTIAFISGGNPEKEIPAGLYFIDSDGSNRWLFFRGAKVYSPDWSPDGEWIVFSNYAQIYKIKVNGDSLTRLTFKGRNFFPDWSPDGKRIAYDRTTNYPDTPAESSGIWIMDSEGLNENHLGLGRAADWCPDSLKMVYVGLGYEIWVADTNGANANRLTFINGDSRYPQWSPDGSKILFSSAKESPPQIFVMDADGTNLKQLTTEGASYPAWSPDGKYIVYTDVRQEYGRLFIMNADGSNKRQLTFEE
jgi:TolB protein